MSTSSMPQTGWLDRWRRRRAGPSPDPTGSPAGELLAGTVAPPASPPELALDALNNPARASEELGAALLEISREIAESQDTRALLQLIAGQAARLSQAADVGLYLLRAGQAELELDVVHGSSSRWASRVAPGEGLVGQAAASRRPQWAEGEAGGESFLAAPMLYAGELAGVMVVAGAPTRPPFGEPEARRLSLLAALAASAVDHARQQQDRQRMTREFTALYGIAANIASTLDLDWVLDLTMRQVQELFHAEKCSLMLLDEMTNELVIQTSAEPGTRPSRLFRLTLNHGIAGWVALKGQPALVNDVRSDPRWYSTIDSATGFVTRSVLAVPLKIRDKIIGVVEVLNKTDGPFAEEHVQLLDSISVVVTQAVENARLFGELNRAYQESAHTQTLILKSRNTLRALFDGITDNICIIDRDLNAQAINRAAAADAGQSPWDLVGKPCRQVVCQSDRPCEECSVVKTLATGESLAASETHSSPRGSRELEIRTYPVLNADEEIDGVIHITRDVTAQRKMEATLYQSAKLSSVVELAAGIAHEINNPLTAVIANAQMLLEAYPADDEHYDSFQLIERAGQRASKVVRSLLDFSRQEQYRFAPLSLNESIDQALMLVAYLLERSKIKITKEWAADLPPLRASGPHLQTVWTNLLLNSRDALAKRTDGEIRITTRPGNDGRSVQVLFSDNGSGIPEKHLHKVFEPFFTTKPQGKGTGLGLYICYTIINQHQGIIRVNSREGKGVTFTIALPIGDKGKVEPEEEGVVQKELAVGS